MKSQFEVEYLAAKAGGPEKLVEFLEAEMTRVSEEYVEYTHLMTDFYTVALETVPFKSAPPEFVDAAKAVADYIKTTHARREYYRSGPPQSGDIYGVLLNILRGGVR